MLITLGNISSVMSYIWNGVGPKLQCLQCIVHERLLTVISG